MKTTAIFALCLAFLTPTLQAQSMIGVAELKNTQKDDIVVVGTAEFEDVTAKSVDITGPLEFKNLTVQGKTNIVGPVKGKKGTLADINVTGIVKLEELTYKSLTAVGETELEKTMALSKTDVTGVLEMEKCKAQDIFVTSDKIELEDTEANNIIVRKIDGSLALQELELKGECVIKGNITFEAGKGLVKMGDKVKHSGTVKGAEVKKS